MTDDIDAFRDRCSAAGLTPTATVGDPAVCRFLTVPDPDGNVLLVVDR